MVHATTILKTTVDETTADLQRLHAILGGVIADGEITEDELRGLATWMQDHECLKSCWPYDEIDSLIIGVMADGKIDAGEHAILKAFFSEFTAIMDDRTITQPGSGKWRTWRSVRCLPRHRIRRLDVLLHRGVGQVQAGRPVIDSETLGW